MTWGFPEMQRVACNYKLISANRSVCCLGDFIVAKMIQYRIFLDGKVKHPFFILFLSGLS